MNSDICISTNRIMSLRDLEKHSPPTSPGLYAWWFEKRVIQKLLPKIRLAGYPEYSVGWIFKKKWNLLYIGRGSNLKRRILDYHFHGDADVSSLRMSLGCILVMELKICLWKRPHPSEGEYGYTFGDEGEEKLSRWMAENAWVRWGETPDHDAEEKKYIRQYAPLLNMDDNPHLFRPLKDLRSELKQCAKLRGDKPPWKGVKAAQERFEEECRNYSSD
jgi:hypothetical protein